MTQLFVIALNLSKDYNDCVGQAVLGIGPYYTRRQSVVASALATEGFTANDACQINLNTTGAPPTTAPTLVDAQLQLGSFYYPLQPMDCEGNAPQAFLELQKALGLTHVRSEYTGPFGFDGQQFIGNNLNSRQNLEAGISCTVPAQTPGAGGAPAVTVNAPVVLLSDHGAPVNGGVIVGNKPAVAVARAQPVNS